MNQKFKETLEKFAKQHPKITYALAVSGGSDSMALMSMMAAAKMPCMVLTVDHELRPESTADCRRVKDAAKALGFPCHILKWTGKKPETGIEEAARQARYALFLDFCQRKEIPVLVTAHQADDQIETFLMNLSRGSGVYGLAGIREQSMRDGVIVFRPMLKMSRAEVLEYCRENNIEYTTDQMNDDDQYLRVRIRKNRHLLADKLDISDERLLLAVENFGRTRDYIEAEARKHRALPPCEFDARTLLSLPDEIRFRALSMTLSRANPLRLDEIKNAFRRLDGQDTKFTLAHMHIRKYHGKIRIWNEGRRWPGV